MKKRILGILGGMGPQATVHFYDLIVRTSIDQFNAKRNSDFPHILINNIPVPDLISTKEHEEETVSMVEEEARRLKQAGCTMFAMPCNTMHLYADRFETASGLPFISMIEAVVEKLREDNIARVGLMGTVTTMRSALYTAPLQAVGIAVVLPDADDQQTIGSLIQTVIAEDIRPSHLNTFTEIVGRLSEHRVDAILLGCTELPLIAAHTKTHTKLYDSTAILAEQCCLKLFEVNNC